MNHKATNLQRRVIKDICNIENIKINEEENSRVQHIETVEYLSVDQYIEQVDKEFLIIQEISNLELTQAILGYYFSKS